MYPRTEYEMSEAQLDKILNACKATPVIMIGSYTGSNPQENANRAWEALGKEMGFDYMTVRPVDGKSSRFFTAVPSETESQKNERLAREKEENRKLEIERIKSEIETLQQKLKELNP